jgi:chloride channel 3/4/5
MSFQSGRGPQHAVTRRFSARNSVSTLPDGATEGNAEQQITEEIEEIKRYEDFTTIDWVQDAAREQLRRRARRRENATLSRRQGRNWFWHKICESYDAGQAWIVVTMVGAVIGLNAAALNIISEWLSDVKLGHCTTAFYLNENFCCWGVENGTRCAGFV